METLRTGALKLRHTDGKIETVTTAGEWSGFGVAWSAAVLLSGDGCPVLFRVERGSPRMGIGHGYTLRRDDPTGRPVFYPVTLIA